MDSEKIKDLLRKQSSGSLTEEEKALLDTWYIRLSQGETTDIDERDMANRLDAVWRALQADSSPQGKIRPLWSRIAAIAAIALLVCGAGTYFILKRQQNVIGPAADIAPYSATSILKSGGKTIILDKTTNGKIAKTIVTKSSGELLSYDQVKGADTAIYDTIQIPVGGRPYTVKLADGSRITLNAATTLRYPETFSENRKEEIELISGEIYAAIVHRPNAPLQIKTPGQMITDIGTEFDVCAYPDDPDTRTTLVKGAVKVSAAGKDITLSPGTQTILSEHKLTSAECDLTEVTAWKNGLFRFKGQHIRDIMRQLARWYNIDVRYQGTITNEVFFGRVARKRNISDVLSILQRSGKVGFTIEGRRVTVWSK